MKALVYALAPMLFINIIMWWPTSHWVSIVYALLCAFSPKLISDYTYPTPRRRHA